jgi:hypothetical protein
MGGGRRREHVLPMTKQAHVLRISRGSVYYLPCPVSPTELEVVGSCWNEPWWARERQRPAPVDARIKYAKQSQ